MENNKMTLERVFVQLILDRLEEKGRNCNQFATAVWPDVPKKTAIGKFNQLHTPNKTTGKYQQLGIDSAESMARELGEDLSYLLSVAKEYLRRIKRGNDNLAG